MIEIVLAQRDKLENETKKPQAKFLDHMKFKVNQNHTVAFSFGADDHVQFVVCTQGNIVALY